MKVHDPISEDKARMLAPPYPLESTGRTELPTYLLDLEPRLESLDRASDCKQSEFATFVVRDQKTWNRIWGLSHNQSHAPHVDFHREMVLAVFLGDQVASGHSVEIADLSETEVANEKVLVTSFVHRAPGKVHLPLISRPYHFVVTATSELPVVFKCIER